MPNVKSRRPIPRNTGPASPIAKMARELVATENAIKELAGVNASLGRQLTRTAADGGRRAILAEKPTTMTDAVISLRSLLGFVFDRVVGISPGAEIDEEDADVIIGSLHELAGFIGKQGGVPKRVIALRL
jgi:hypothetical protein